MKLELGTIAGQVLCAVCMAVLLFATNCVAADSELEPAVDPVIEKWIQRLQPSSISDAQMREELLWFKRVAEPFRGRHIKSVAEDIKTHFSLIHAFRDDECGQIYIAAVRQGKNLLLTYKDNGSGIEKASLERIFEPFFTTRRGQGGTGLGMHIVYNLVTHKLKGTIQCSSQASLGVQITITIPCEFV